MHDNQQTCVLIVDHEDFLEGILTLGDIQQKGFETGGEVPDTPKGDSTISDVMHFECSCAFTFDQHMDKHPQKGPS